MGLFKTTDAATISSWLIQQAQDGCSTTLYEGDERRIFIESVITPIFVAIYNVIDDVAKQKMRKYARGIVLDAIGGEQCKRLEASNAKTIFQFFCKEPAQNDIVIPAGTRIASNNDYYFATDKDCVLNMGMTKVEVSGSAVMGGSSYNDFLPETICIIVDNIIGIDGCKNIVATHDGDDGEPYDTQGDDRYRERIGLFEDSFSTCGTENGYRYYAMSADSSVANVNIVTAEEVESTEDCDVLIYIVCSNGETPNEEIVKKVYEKCNAKDARPMCDCIKVKSAEPVLYDIELQYSVSEADEQAAISIIEASGGVIDQYVAAQDIQISKPINPDMLFAKIMGTQDENGNVLDIKRCIIKKPEYQNTEYNQVAHFSGNIVISHTVM